MTRHPFEPARLLLGALLLGAGVVCLLDVSGDLRVPAVALALLVPAALLVGALASVTTYLLRRALGRRRRGDGTRPGGDERAGVPPRGRSPVRTGGPDGPPSRSVRTAHGAHRATTYDGSPETSPLGDLPMDELRRGYQRSGPESGQRSGPEPGPPNDDRPEPPERHR